MNSRNYGILQTPTPVFFTSNGEEEDSVEEKLWQLSTHKFEAKFFNGKPLEIEYNFDPARPEEDRVFISLDSLVPVFGGVLPEPSAAGTFAAVWEMFEFVESSVHLNKCPARRRPQCYPGPYENPSVDKCRYGHFHHYCWLHVVNWLDLYLKTTILLRESKELFDEEIARQYSSVTEDIVYYQTDKRATPEFLLASACWSKKKGQLRNQYV